MVYVRCISLFGKTFVELVRMSAGLQWYLSIIVFHVLESGMLFVIYHWFWDKPKQIHVFLKMSELCCAAFTFKGC